MKNNRKTQQTRSAVGKMHVWFSRTDVWNQMLVFWKRHTHSTEHLIIKDNSSVAGDWLIDWVPCEDFRKGGGQRPES